MTTFLLIRHGENAWVKEHRLAGWTPGVQLNERGRTQAEQIAERLAHLPIDAVYSSPLERCLETAEPLARRLGLPVQPLPAVGEVRYGAWQGANLHELAKLPEWRTVQHAPSRFQFPDGEALRDVQARAVGALEQLAAEHPEGCLAVFSHADVIKLVLAHYMGMHLDQFQRLGVSTASLSVVVLSAAGAVQVVRVNDDGPLQLPPRPPTADPAAAEPTAESADTQPRTA